MQREKRIREAKRGRVGRRGDQQVRLLRGNTPCFIQGFSNVAHLAIVATLGFYSLKCILEIAHNL